VQIILRIERPEAVADGSADMDNQHWREGNKPARIIREMVDELRGRRMHPDYVKQVYHELANLVHILDVCEIKSGVDK
jgi:hypothetical protein